MSIITNTTTGSAGYSVTQPHSNTSESKDLHEYAIRFRDGSFSNPVDSLDLARLYLASIVLTAAEGNNLEYEDAQIVERTHTRVVTVDRYYTPWQFPVAKIPPLQYEFPKEGEDELYLESPEDLEADLAAAEAVADREAAAPTAFGTVTTNNLIQYITNGEFL